MSRRQLIILVAAALIVVAGIVTGIIAIKNGGFNAPGEKEEGPEVTIPGAGGEEIPVFSSETPVNAELSESAVEAPAAPGAEEKFSAFNMTVSSAGFSPNEITVGKGDVVQIRLTAEGGDYDFSMPYTGHYVVVPEGETKQITFGINTVGTYAFMCRDYCHGKTISGSLIVLP